MCQGYFALRWTLGQALSYPGMANVLLTGANRGIGAAMTTQFARRGDHVWAWCRQSSDTLRDPQIADRVTIQDGVDVTSQERVTAAAADCPFDRVDLLVLNAGLLKNERLDDMNFDTIRDQLEVNAIAPLRVVSAVLPRLTQGSKVAIITSRMGSMADNGSGGYYGYRMSKAAVNAAGVSLARDLVGSGIAVAILHPGFVQTDMTQGNGDITPQRAAEGLIQRMDELSLERTGEFRHMNGEQLPW